MDNGLSPNTIGGTIKEDFDGHNLGKDVLSKKKMIQTPFNDHKNRHNECENQDDLIPTFEIDLKQKNQEEGDQYAVPNDQIVEFQENKK